MMEFVSRWLITSVVAIVSFWFEPDLNPLEKPPSFAIAILLGFVSAFLRPMILRLVHGIWVVPAIGAALILANALLLFFLTSILPGFATANWIGIFFAALPPSLVCWALSLFFLGERNQLHFITYHGRAKRYQPHQSTGNPKKPKK